MAIFLIYFISKELFLIVEQYQMGKYVLWKQSYSKLLIK